MLCRFASIFLVACCLLIQSAASGAAEPPIAPLLFDDAWLVARIDVERVQLEPLYAMLDQVVGIGGLPSRQSASEFVAKFRQAGGRELYLVWGKSTGILFTPLADGANATAMQTALIESPLRRYLPLEATDQIAGGVAAGSRSMLLYLRELKAKPRPHLARALAATSASTLQLLLLPTDENRTVAAGFAWPMLAPDAASRAMKQISWASIGIDGPPQPRLKMVFEARDASSAEGLEAALAGAIEPMVSDKDVRKNVALVERLRRILVWQRVGDTLSLEVDDRQGDLTVVTRGMIQPVLQTSLLAGAHRASMKQLRQLSIAMQNYHDAFKHFPAPAFLDGEGKPLLSWRVAILPFMEQNALYGQFHLDEPWDSPHNKTLLGRMPEVYRCPVARVPHDHTVYLTPRGEGTAFAGPEGTPIRRITDGTSKTIGIVEVNDAYAVPWTKPDDWPFNPDQPTAGLGGHFPKLFLAALCDGSAHALKLAIDPEVMRRLFSSAGGEVVAIPH